MPEMTEPIRICESAALEDGGLGVRFPVEVRGRAVSAFVVRYAGSVHGYLNQCAHVPMEIDRKSTRLNSSHIQKSRMPSSA